MYHGEYESALWHEEKSIEDKYLCILKKCPENTFLAQIIGYTDEEVKQGMEYIIDSYGDINDPCLALKCFSCHAERNYKTSAYECAKCPEREMRDGYCRLKK